MMAMTPAPHSVADGQSYRTYVINRNKVDLNFFFLDKKIYILKNERGTVANVPQPTP
jgi:hypothetical protein